MYVSDAVLRSELKTYIPHSILNNSSGTGLPMKRPTAKLCKRSRRGRVRGTVGYAVALVSAVRSQGRERVQL